MNKLSVLLAAITSICALLAVPAQAQVSSTLMDILEITGSLNRRMDCHLSDGKNCGSIDEDEINRAIERIRQGESESGSSFTNGEARQNQNSPSLQSESNVILSSFCDGYLKGAAIGAAITGNYSSVPDACRQYMPQPSSSQQSNRWNSDRYVEQQELRNRQIQRNADINLESNRDSNCLASSEGCVWSEISDE